MKNDLYSLFPQHSLALAQPTLFQMTPEAFTAQTSVSLDEMKLWNEKGWLSFDPDMIKDYDERERVEVLFIKALARSGLSYAMIERLLSGLKKPYCYDPQAAFFSFAKGSWITLPKEPDPADMAYEGIEALIGNKAWDELAALKERISEVLEEDGCVDK
jgi:hypothetical protein